MFTLSYCTNFWQSDLQSWIWAFERYSKALSCKRILFRKTWHELFCSL